MLEQVEVKGETLDYADFRLAGVLLCSQLGSISCPKREGLHYSRDFDLLVVALLVAGTYFGSDNC